MLIFFVCVLYVTSVVITSFSVIRLKMRCVQFCNFTIPSQLDSQPMKFVILDLGFTFIHLKSASCVCG